MDVDRYVEASSLWLHHPDGRDEEIVPEGALTMEELVVQRETAFGALFYLRFVGSLGLRDSTNVLKDARRLMRRDENRFKAGVGRLARGGLLPRIADGLFALSLIVRGNVPGATAAAAILKYTAMQEAAERYVYYGRVVRQGGWTVCQYWFFFAYNPWRSGFHGVNDHESDWEMISVYLYEDDGRLVPEWAAYASHDFHGADLRRRWDDRDDLERVGDHPVVCAGAGSHASYYRPGEYQARGAGPGPGAAADDRSGHEHALAADARPGDERRRAADPVHRLRARGRADDRSGAGPGVGARRDLRGDAVGGALPRHVGPVRARPDLRRERAGRPDARARRHAAGVVVRPAPLRRARPAAAAAAGARPARGPARDARGPAGRARRPDRRTRRSGCSSSAPASASSRAAPICRPSTRCSSQRVAEQSLAVNLLLKERVDNRAELEGVARRIERARAGRADGPRDHIRQPMAPVPPETMRFRRTAEFWAAISVSGLLIGLSVFILFTPSEVLPAVIILLLGFLMLDSLLRGTYAREINRVAVILALVSVVVLVVEFWKEAIVGVLCGFALFLILQRVREFRS